jgi:hypothetical protein
MKDVYVVPSAGADAGERADRGPETMREISRVAGSAAVIGDTLPPFEQVAVLSGALDEGSPLRSIVGRLVGEEEETTSGFNSSL